MKCVVQDIVRQDDWVDSIQQLLCLFHWSFCSTPYKITKYLRYQETVNIHFLWECSVKHRLNPGLQNLSFLYPRQFSNLLTAGSPTNTPSDNSSSLSFFQNENPKISSVRAKITNEKWVLPLLARFYVNVVLLPCPRITTKLPKESTQSSKHFFRLSSNSE